MLEYSKAFLEQNEQALSELLELLTPNGQRAAMELADMELEALQQETADLAPSAGPAGA